MRSVFHSLLLLSVTCTLVASTGCGAATTQRSTIAPPKPPPSVVTDATYGDALRHFSVLAFDDPQRASLRERLVAHLLSKTPEVIAKDDYDALVEHFAAVTSLYTPAEIAANQLPGGLEPLARRLLERSSRRGDEARALSALLALHSAHPEDKVAPEQYRGIKEWGFESRAALSAPLERFEEGLLEVWEEHAHLTPTPDVLTTLARLYIERRNALIALFQSSEHRVPLSAAIFEGVQRTAMSVAAVYLRYGDVASALSSVQTMGSTGGVEQRLTEILGLAREEGAEGTGALLDLARAYLEDGRPDVSRALCLTGLREQRADARFSQCLARISATQNDYAGAMAWYAEAVRLMPEERALYDEILEVLNNLMEQGLFGSDTTQTRAIASRAAEILEERMKRWPDAPPAVKPEDLYLAIAIAEMNAGNATEAETRLRQSLQAKETVGGLLQLGLLLERMNRNAEAADQYRRALQIVGAGHGEDEPKRAEILERLGDALRMTGKPQEASKMYAQGLALWDQNLSRQKGQRIGLAHLRKGVLLGRLARRNDAESEFEKAMEFAPDMRETYSTILSYLAVSEPDSHFAHQVFHNALNQLSLEPEWKVYFALWLRMIAGRSGGALEGDVSAVFEDLSQGSDWWANLAKFAAGKIDFNALLGAASDVGERTEAYFYEGARRLGSGNPEGAREMFQHVIDSNMVNFYEYAMAQELIAQTGPPAAPKGAAPANPGPSSALPANPAPSSALPASPAPVAALPASPAPAAPAPSQPKP
jgi:tetratricopeptide (TPR) repeat protein